MKKEEFDATIKKFQTITKVQRVDIQNRERRAVIKEIKRKMHKGKIEQFRATLDDGREVGIMAIAVYRLEGLLTDVSNKYDKPDNWRAE